VPKIAINEDRDLLLRESDIGRSFQSLVVSLKTQAYLLELTLNQYL